MSSYLSRVLAANERVVYEAKPHWIIFVWPVFWTVISIGFLLPITAIWFIGAVLLYINTDLAATDRRVIAKTGVISRSSIELRLAKIEAIRVDQGILGRMLDYGTVIVSGTGVSHTPFKNIANPLAFKRAVEAEVERIEQATQGGRDGA